MIDNKNKEQVSEEKQPNNWLQRLKDESWEAELLVSAIAIFGTFQLFNVIDWSTNKFIDLLPESQHSIAYFIVFMGLLAVSILVSMFVIHFFLRAYWVGLVGLNSVFPDYSIKDSAYPEIYTKKLLTILPKLKDSLKKVDELCSVIFSAAFTILLIYAYIAITSSIYLFLFNFLSDYISGYFMLVPIGIIIFILVLQIIFGVIANLKVFKQNEKIQIWYFKIVKLASICTFGPLYKSILQVSMTFGSNFKKNKAIVGLILLFLFSGIFVSSYQASKSNIFYLINKDYFFNDTEIYSGYYKTENEHLKFLLSPEIESDLIKSNRLKLFIPIFSHEKSIRKIACGTFEEDSSKEKSEQRKQIRSQYLDCYHKYNQVFINGEKVSPDFMKYYHPKTNQFGIVCYIKLTNTIDGKNIITIKKAHDKEVFAEWSIPFQYILKKY